MKEILLNLFQAFNNPAGRSLNGLGEPRGIPAWLNSKKRQLFLNADEITFSADWIKLMEGDAEMYIDWREMKYFYYPFVGVNIRLPGFTRSKYFSLIVREKMENHPLLNEFIIRLKEQSEFYRPFVIPAVL